MTKEAHNESFLINWADGWVGFWWLAPQRVGTKGWWGQGLKVKAVWPVSFSCRCPAVPHCRLQRGPESCSTPLCTESELEGTSDVLDGVQTREGLVTCQEVKSRVKALSAGFSCLATRPPTSPFLIKSSALEGNKSKERWEQRQEQNYTRQDQNT